MKLRKLMHGEVVIKEITKLPEDLKEINIKEDYIVVGASSTIGNDHRIAVKDKEKIKFYEKDGVLYMVNLTETNVYCPKTERHAPSTLPPSIWKIDKRKEWDYIEQQVRAVRD